MVSLITDLSIAVVLSDSEGASRSEEESKDPEAVFITMPSQGVLTRIDFPAAPAKETTASLVNQFLTEFLAGASFQPACILAKKYPRARQVSAQANHCLRHDLAAIAPANPSAGGATTS
jgi:hypothetical protein